MPSGNGLTLVFQYFLAAGFGVGFGILFPFILGVWLKKKIEEGELPWQRRKKTAQTWGK
jgi:hypothetical protein